MKGSCRSICPRSIRSFQLTWMDSEAVVFRNLNKTLKRNECSTSCQAARDRKDRREAIHGHSRGIDEDTFGWVQQNNQQQMRGLAEEVQQIKSGVLGIAAELNQLEEKLLYPSGTQVAIFVSLAKGDQMRLDVRLQIDGQLVAHCIYNFKELEALRKGGALHKKSWAVIDRP